MQLTIECLVSKWAPQSENCCINRVFLAQEGLSQV